MTERVDVEGLLPCPFCGGDGKLYDNEWVRNVICQDCGASTFDTEQSLESARDEWNRRASPPSLLAEFAALRAENEGLKAALTIAEREAAFWKPYRIDRDVDVLALTIRFTREALQTSTLGVNRFVRTALDRVPFDISAALSAQEPR